jgi:hypothetical protein
MDNICIFFIKEKVHKATLRLKQQNEENHKLKHHGHDNTYRADHLLETLQLIDLKKTGQKIENNQKNSASESGHSSEDKKDKSDEDVFRDQSTETASKISNVNTVPPIVEVNSSETFYKKYVLIIVQKLFSDYFGSREEQPHPIFSNYF